MHSPGCGQVPPSSDGGPHQTGLHGDARHPRGRRERFVLCRPHGQGLLQAEAERQEEGDHLSQPGTHHRETHCHHQVNPPLGGVM